MSKSIATRWTTLYAVVEGLSKIVGVQEVGGVVKQDADSLALSLVQRGAVDEVRPQNSAWTNQDSD